MTNDNDDNKNKVTNLKTVASKEKDELLAAFENIKRVLPEMFYMQKEIAKMQRARYVALVKEGFDNEQALELTAKMSMLIK